MDITSGLVNETNVNEIGGINWYVVSSNVFVLNGSKTQHYKL